MLLPSECLKPSGTEATCAHNTYPWSQGSGPWAPETGPSTLPTCRLVPEQWQLGSGGPERAFRDAGLPMWPNALNGAQAWQQWASALFFGMCWLILVLLCPFRKEPVVPDPTHP